MAVEADCGESTVLEALRVARTTRFPVLGECRGPRDETLRNSAMPTRASRWGMQIGDGKFEIRNSKFEISQG